MVCHDGAPRGMLAGEYQPCEALPPRERPERAAGDITKPAFSEDVAMRTPAARLLAMIAALAVLATLVAPATAAGVTVRRVWVAPISGNGAHGEATLTAYTNFTGRFDVAATGLHASTGYNQMIYKGTCATPTRLVSIHSFTTDANGNGTNTYLLSGNQMAVIWKLAWVGSPIAYRLASADGKDVHCSVLTYPVATRVVVQKYGIDLPVVLQRGNAFPLCNVAMYLVQLSQPGEPGVTYLYAHARKGMFLPLLTASQVGNGQAMIGMKVRVWTSDSKLYQYTVKQVRRHVTSIAEVGGITGEQLWLQTSEGPYGTYEKLILVATRDSGYPQSATYAESHPTPHPVVCGVYG